MGEWRASLEALEMNRQFWSGKRVLVTGHTGFKGGWLSLCLADLGAFVYGIALPPEDGPALFTDLALQELVDHRIGDIRDLDTVRRIMQEARPEIVFHLAAQPLVTLSYDDPVSTFATNVMGTVHVLEACRQVGSVRALVVVTSDKCYENMSWCWGYRETDRLGGKDPYSNSKACAELVTQAYRDSFFADPAGLRVASARAGNVIGGGDWATFRLVPDAMRAFLANEALNIRNPDATRPWQHVLEPLRGYLLLAEALCDSPSAVGAWNFGPVQSDNVPVSVVATKLCRLWGAGARWESTATKGRVQEAQVLHVDSAKALRDLGWRSTISLDTALEWTVDWFKSREAAHDMRRVTLGQLREFATAANATTEAVHD